MKAIDNRYEQMEIYLEARANEKVFILPDKVYREPDILKIRQLIKKYKSVEVMKCFEKSTSKDFSLYTVVLSCEDCAEPNAWEQLISKTAFKKIIDNKHKKCLCVNCSLKKEEEKKKKEKQYQQEYGLTKMQNTDTYISSYLDPNKVWDEKTKHYQRFQYISCYYNVDNEKIYQHIKSMNYSDFLKTPYWKAIAWKCKRNAEFACQLCAEKHGLETHHRSYDIHGKEHIYWKQLIVLCRKCHGKFHDKLEEIA